MSSAPLPGRYRGSYPLVVPKWLARDSFFILLMVQFMRGAPVELDDSATIDGCGS
jgi:multiple sugar transport system permease protein